MRFDRTYKLDRILMVAIAIFGIILSIYNYLSLSEEKSIWVLVRTILPTLLFFIALKFPSMIYSTVLAGIGAFWSVMAIFIVLTVCFEEILASAIAIFVIIGFICACINAGKAVIWVRELRDVEKTSDAAGGTDQMTKGLIRFLFPRNSFSIIMAVCLVILVVCFFRTGFHSEKLNMETVIIFSLIYVLLPAGVFLSVLSIVKNIRGYRSYIREISESGVLSRAVYDYYQGKQYCKDSVVLGQKYIFVQGAAMIYEYRSIEKILHSWSDSSRYGYWRLNARNTDGTEYTLIELPFRHTKKNYDNYVLPMLDEIKKINSTIQISEPGKFSRF